MIEIAGFTLSVFVTTCVVLAGCSMSYENVSSKVAYCKQHGMKVIMLDNLKENDKRVYKVMCEDSEGYLFNAKDAKQ